MPSALPGEEDSELGFRLRLKLGASHSKAAGANMAVKDLG